MSFLSKIGQVLNASTGLIPVFGPIISILAPKTAPTIQTISTVNDNLINIASDIARVEALGQALHLSGARKLEIAAPQIASILLNSPLLIGKKIGQPLLFMQGVTQISGGMADILNSIDEAEAPTEIPPLQVIPLI